jgi:ubiquitin C-terminal hydrolase
LSLDLEASTSTVNIEKLSVTLVRQNFAKQNITKLSDVEKHLTAFLIMYNLRGIINFHGGERRGIRSATGHYTANAFQGNEKWETYDDTKTAIQHTKQAFNVEFLIYTI